MPKKSIKINQNLKLMKVKDLKALFESLNIDEDSIRGSGKNGKLLKEDYIVAIEDHQAKKGTKTSIDKPEPPKKTKRESPKKVVNKSPSKIKLSPAKGKRVISG